MSAADHHFLALAVIPPDHLLHTDSGCIEVIETNDNRTGRQGNGLAAHGVIEMDKAGIVVQPGIKCIGTDISINPVNRFPQIQID